MLNVDVGVDVDAGREFTTHFITTHSKKKEKKTLEIYVLEYGESENEDEMM